MSLTSVEICANALVRLGAQPIQSFTEGTDIATFCDTIYSQKKKFVLSSYPWRFSMKYVQLSRLVASPTAQWTYQFTLPADRVQGGFPVVYTSEDVSASPIREYTIFGDKLMTDQTEIWVQYQANVDESFWSEYFTELMIMIMKTELCVLVTDNSALYDSLKQEVYGSPAEGGIGGLFARATNLDSRDNPTTYITDFSLIEARFGGV